MFDWISNLPIAIIMLLVMSFFMSKASDKLGDVLHILGVKLNIPTSVRGATFDAISSSFPEFSTAMIAVLVFNDFSNVGVPTIAGSGIFNILIIPMLSILAYRGNKIIKADKNNILRDMAFYSLSVGALIFFTYTGSYNAVSGLVLIAIYCAYVGVLYMQTKKHRSVTDIEDVKGEAAVTLEIENEDDMSYGKMIIWIVIAIAVIWITIEGIVQSATVISDGLNIPKYIVSVIILAACTSIPDTILSVKSAKEGDIEGAVANAVGSNIFDICLCLGLPMIISGQVLPANFQQNVGVLAFLIISMLTTAMVLLKKKGATKKDALLMTVVYLAFLVYIIGVATNLF
ncbi:sodium:calcium antiporter [Oceanirhabdus seepicola]|uniref:Sodium:calcium antiporter n=1 Tax=Oceanirhabdus seepicola TaxID=2828781 RepID=A0A9J6PDJ4_9CLOT|nr:sodium:calcium antiporter [Oceanirhabdus seepicola]MCM1992821.1 sodium:calcium antiporter [Oceanirhabdus seepicola]